MRGVWVRAFCSALFCLLIGVVVYSCQWPETADEGSSRSDEKKSSAVVSQIRTDESRKRAIERIRDRGELRVGMQIGYVPFEMIGRNGAVVGLDVDLARLTAHELGVGLRIVKKQWNELIPALLNDEIDVIMSAMTLTPRRNIEVMFCNPLLETGRMLAVHRKNADTYKSLVDVNREGIFIVSGPEGPGPLRIDLAAPKASYRSFPTKERAAEEVMQGRAHVLIDREFAVRELCARHPDALTSGLEPLTYEPIAWAVQPDEYHWLNWLNNFLCMLRHDGTLDELKKKWLRDYYLDMSS